MIIRVAGALAAAFLIAAAAAAADVDPDEPRWAVEIQGGSLRSAMDDWGDYYGDDRLGHLALGVAHRPWRLLEIGVEIGYRSDDGRGFAPLHGTLAGDVAYRLFPFHAGALLHLGLYQDQWFVPYAGIAAGRAVYRVKVEGQGTATGGVTSTQFRVGVRLLLDRLEPRSAAELRDHFGIINTYLFAEFRREEAEVNGSDLGGRAWSGGLRLEF